MTRYKSNVILGLQYRIILEIGLLVTCMYEDVPYHVEDYVNKGHKADTSEVARSN